MTEKKGQYNKKVTKEAPTGPIRPKSYLAGDVNDTITCAKFQIQIFMGYDFTWDQIFDFPIDFCMGLTTVQC